MNDMKEMQKILIEFSSSSTGGMDDATDAGKLGLFLRRLNSLCALVLAVDACDRESGPENDREYFIDAMYNRVMNKEIDSESLKKEMIKKIRLYHKTGKIKAKGGIRSTQFNFISGNSGAGVLYVESIEHGSPPVLKVFADLASVLLALLMLSGDMDSNVNVRDNVNINVNVGDNVNIGDINVNMGDDITCIRIDGRLDATSGRIPEVFREINNCQLENRDDNL